MIVTSQKARRIVSSHAVLQQVPELLAAVEAHADAAKQLALHPNCPKCRQADFFGPVELQALQAIEALSPEAARRLMAFLGEKELYLYSTQPGKPPVTKQLGL